MSGRSADEWEVILAREGMPAELPPLRAVSLETLADLPAAVPDPGGQFTVLCGGVLGILLRRRLTRMERAVVQLWCGEGCGEREIGGRLGISRHQVRAMKGIIRQKIRGENLGVGGNIDRDGEKRL